MAPKKSTSVVVPSVPVVEIKQEELNKIKTEKEIPLVVPKVKKVKKVKKVEIEQPIIEKPVIVKTPPQIIVEPQEIEIESNIEELNEEEVVNEDTENTGENIEVKKRVRRAVNKESFYHDFESFVEQVNSFLELVKNEKGIKNTKSVIVKKLKQLQNDSYKLLRIKSLFADKKPGADVNSGFMKPIKISGDLASFFQSNPEEPMTRVQVTKKLCQYIKENDLQNPEDRREILPDDKLKSLFNLGGEKLTYYSMQKQIQQHIYKI